MGAKIGIFGKKNNAKIAFSGKLFIFTKNNNCRIDMKKNVFLLSFFALTLLVNGQTERKITPSPALASKTDTLGVAFLNDETPTLTGETIDQIDQIASIKLRKNNYKMTAVNPDAFRLNGLQVDYHNALMFSKVGRLPDLNLPGNRTNPADFFRTGVSFQNSVNTKFRFTPENIIEQKNCLPG